MSTNAKIDAGGNALDAVARRASRAAGVNASIHRFADSRETELLAHAGSGCAACAHVGNHPWGAQACRRSREKAGTTTLRRNRPIPFICHMGFSCVSMALPSLDDDDARVLTLGPFRPSATPEEPEAEAREGLQRLHEDVEESLPFVLTDIPITVASAVPEVAVWSAEWWALLQQEPVSPSNGTNEDRSPRPLLKRGRKNRLRPSHAHDLAAALASGDSAEARLLVRGALEEVGHSERRLRHRALLLIAMTLEAAEQSGVPTDAVEARAALWTADTAECHNSAEFSRAVMRVLAPLKPPRKRPGIESLAADNESWLTRLERCLDEAFPERVTLSAAAAALELEPAALTKRLQRKFALSYSDFAGRHRIRRAQRMLRSTKLSVAEIAKRVGLNDASNFSKLFVKHTGLTPTQYRDRFPGK